MGLLGVDRIHLLLHQILHLLRHLLPPLIDSLIVGRLPNRAGVLAWSWRKRLRLAFLLGNTGVEESLRIEDGTVDLHALASFLDTQLLLFAPAHLPLGAEENVGREHQ